MCCQLSGEVKLHKLSTCSVLAATILFATLAAADDLKLDPQPLLLPKQNILDIIAQKQGNTDAGITPLCAKDGSLGFCNVFALPSETASSPKPDYAPGPLEQDVRRKLGLQPSGLDPALNLACPKDAQFHSCRLVDSLTNLPPGEAGLTLYATGSKSAELSRLATEGLLTPSDVRAVINEKTIGILPEAVEAGAAERAIGVLANSGIAKTGRAAAVVGAVLMTYAAYQYFFPSEDKTKKEDEPTAK
jgi:hypothetical protein